MNENAYQAMPRQGRLAKNLNLAREALSEKIARFLEDTVYYYVVDTVEYENGRLYQTGSGPNFQGDLITLCSCKHLMRTYPDVQPGVWVAGFTNSKVMGRNRLFYLMRVSEAFESHRAFWLSDSILEETKNAKVADQDRFGDIYQPKVETSDPYSPSSYLEPCKNHVHCEPGDWRKDINYRNRYGRRPTLLVGDSEYSFLWDRPVITYPSNLSKLTQGQRKDTLTALLGYS